MQRLTMLVTSDGQWVFENSAEFLEALGDPAPDYDAAQFAVKNLGFIKFQMLDDMIIEIELHPRTVKLPALLSVQERLRSCHAKLFRIKHLQSNWLSEITSSAEDAVSRLSLLCADVFVPPSAERYRAELQDFSKIFVDEESPFRPVARKWRISFGQFDDTVIPFAIKNHVFSRLMIVGVKPPAVEPVFRFIGDGFRWIGEENHLNAIGEKVANQPDKEYGTWVSEFYRGVAMSGQPRYDIVSAVLRWEDEPGKPHRLVRYERMLLPWRTTSRETLVTLSSRILTEDSSSDALSAFPDRSVAMKRARSS